MAYAVRVPFRGQLGRGGCPVRRSWASLQTSALGTYRSINVTVIHNHPSGDPTLSRADIEMTKAVARALETVGVTLHDHVIVGRKGHASFRSLGLL